jgi:SOS-response transcriptional repressor LexA
MFMKEEVGKRLKEFAERFFTSYSEFARKLETRPQHLNNFFSGLTMPGAELLTKLSKIGLNINWLFTGDGEMMIGGDTKPGKTKSRMIPLVSNVQCGVPLTEWMSNAERFIEVEGIKSMQNPFAVVAQGMSMAQTILPGDVLVCYESTEQIKDNTIVLVSFKTEPDTTLGLVKRVKFLDDGKVVLYSDNARNFPPMVYNKTDIYKLYPVYNKFIRNVK